MNWKNSFEKGKEVILATASKNGLPNANIVISLGFIDDQLLIANRQMNSTIKNIKENNYICVIGGHYKLCGEVKILASGNYFDKSVKIVTSQDKTLKVKNALLIKVNEVFDLDKVKKII